MEGTQGELFDNLCETHKEGYDGRKYMVLVNLRTGRYLWYSGDEPVEASGKLPVGTLWKLANTIHPNRIIGD
jgi:hypothetical protein